MRTILIVEADLTFREPLMRRLTGIHVNVEAVGDFASAYARLTLRPPDLMVTNLRLHGDVTGLQLAYVAASGRLPMRTVVYGDDPEPWVVREVQRLGAFYETQSRLLWALQGYAQSSLPVLDRRNPESPDRRSNYRGGRRASDVPGYRGR